MVKAINSGIPSSAKAVKTAFWIVDVHKIAPNKANENIEPIVTAVTVVGIHARNWKSCDEVVIEISDCVSEELWSSINIIAFSDAHTKLGQINIRRTKAILAK